MLVEQVAAPARAAALTPALAAQAGRHDRDGSFPLAAFDLLLAADLIGLTVPRDRGGGGAGLAETCRVIETVARGDASVALVLAMHHIYHAVFARGGRWPEPLGARLQREGAAELGLVNVMRVEPELGTPSRGGLPATVAEAMPDGWRLTGHKIYATGSPILRYFIVWARTAEAQPRTGYFLVPRRSAGVKIVETWDHLGMRATGSHDLLLDGVVIPPEYALDVRPPAGWSAPDPATAGWNNLVLSALYYGVATAARDWLAAYLHERAPANLGAPLASPPRVQEKVGEISALLYAAERLIYGLAEEIDRGAPAETATQSATVKYLATNQAVRAVELALSLTGNPGLARSRPLERHYRDVLCSRIHSPQDDMVLLAAGRSALGLPGAR